MSSTPRYGGTLRLYGPGSMDHVDPACSYYMLAGQILRLCTRQLFAYEAVRDLSDPRAVTPAPDVAAEVPTISNGGVSADYLTYTIRLRSGVFWDTTPPRAVTAPDFVRGFKRMCNPVIRAGAINYYTTTIKGVAEFCDGYPAAVSGRPPTAAELATYQNSRDITGLRAVAEHTLIFELIRPANDFLNILAMTFTSAAPVEYDAFVPDSAEFRRNTRSCGPYRLVHYVHGQELRMERNPVWRQESDHIRHQYVDGIEVTMEKATPDQVRKKIVSGAADLSWASPVTEPYEISPTSPSDRLGFALNPYLVFNLLSPNAGGAMAKLKVRQAIAYAIDKVAIVKIFDDLSAGTVMGAAHTAIPPGNLGYQDYDLYPTPDDRGDPDKCRKLLAEAGYENGLTITAVHRDVDANPEVAESYAADLEKAGITVRLVALGHKDYYPFLQDPANARAGAWDISAPSWTPDWFGNNGRAFLQPMVQTNDVCGTSNYGCYSNADVDRLIETALTATDQEQAGAAWHEVDLQVMRDAVIVPILVHAPTIPHICGARVRNAIAMPTIDRWFDLSNLWLDDTIPVTDGSDQP